MGVLIFLIVLFVIDYYAWQSFRLAILNWPDNLRTPATLIYLAILVLCYFYIVGSMARWFGHFDSQLNMYLRAFVFILFLSKIMMGIFMVVDDFRRLFGLIVNQVSAEQHVDLSRSRFLSLLGIVAGGIPLATLTYGMIRNPYRYQLQKMNLGLKNLPSTLQGLRIVHISDIHAGSFTATDPLRKGIDMINDLNPDLVFFTGDLVNNRAGEITPYLDVFRNVKARYGVYSVLGNHDYGDYHRWDNESEKKANFQELLSMHSELGWDLLRNEHRLVHVNGTSIAVIGVENSSASPRFHNYGDLSLASMGTESSPLKLLLSHDPSHWNAEVTKDFPQIDITFSGHTHGFQFGIEIPGWIKWSPSQWVYKQWAGLYQQGTQFIYVNRGFGMLGYPGRVGILPEITCIDLQQSPADAI